MACFPVVTYPSGLVNYFYECGDSACSLLVLHSPAAEIGQQNMLTTAACLSGQTCCGPAQMQRINKGLNAYLHMSLIRVQKLERYGQV